MDVNKIIAMHKASMEDLASFIHKGEVQQKVKQIKEGDAKFERVYANTLVKKYLEKHLKNFRDLNSRAVEAIITEIVDHYQDLDGVVRHIKENILRIEREVKRNPSLEFDAVKELLAYK